MSTVEARPRKPNLCASGGPKRGIIAYGAYGKHLACAGSARSRRPRRERLDNFMPWARP